ncbi:MAG: lytic transglycosylase domain-containing protein [Acidobacteriota bacterium]|nr:lytic transglycosylase domain-containing protein [Acidobacteriota bacterium]
MKHLYSTRSCLFLAAALTAAACFDEPAGPTHSARDQLLNPAFGLVDSDPGQAARLFAEAGAGPILEAARLASWAECLERSSAPSDAWRRFLDAPPPPTTAATARLQLIAALVAEGDFSGAAVERSLLPDEYGPAGDELLLTVGNEPTRLAAAQRLAVTAPRRLSTHDRDLDRRLLAGLGPEERLRRSRAWRRENAPSRAATELGSQRWSGDVESERRRELAHAQLDAGSPRRALRALPDGRDAESTDLTLRAQALRNRAWSLWPAGSAQRAFADCGSAADRALAMESDRDQRRAALVLRLECATESKRLETAFDSWRQLETAGWDDSRRDWLGRRLGVALAVRGGDRDRVLEIARALPSQSRCLNFWVAASAATGGQDLEALAAVSVPDLYANWSLEMLGRTAPIVLRAVPPVAPGPPPASVQRLLDAGAETEAAREWRRIRRARRPAPGEALAGAQLAAQLGQANDTIRWLRAGFPELGTVSLTEAPENAVEAYLPLRWRLALMAAAAEFGLDPWLVAGIARQESTFTAHAVSPRGAVGAMQLLPSTASGHAKALGIGATPDLRNAELNLRLGARELARLLRRFGAVEPALAAYNGGETRIRKWWKQQPDRRRFTEEIPIPETYTYVRRVIYLREAYRQVYDTNRRTPP